MKNIEIIKESTAILKVDRNKFESHPLFKSFFYQREQYICSRN